MFDKENVLKRNNNKIGHIKLLFSLLQLRDRPPYEESSCPYRQTLTHKHVLV